MSTRPKLVGLAHALAWTLLWTAGTAAAAASTPLDRLERSLQTTKDLTAVVLQTRRSPLLEDPIEADGRLWLRKPGDVRIEYTTPEPTTLLKQADTTWLYVPSLEQVQRTRASHAGIPLEWVLGSSLVEIERIAELIGEDDRIVLRPLEPKRSAWREIEIRFEGESAFPNLYRIHDRAGETVEVRLSKIQRNTGVAADRFVPRWPEGIEIISLGE